MSTTSSIFERGLELGYKRALKKGCEDRHADYFAQGFSEGYMEEYTIFIAMKTVVKMTKGVMHFIFGVQL